MFGLKLFGFKELSEHLDKMEKEFDAKLKIAFTESANIFQERAKKNVPVRAGHLRRSITHNVKKVGKEWVGEVGTNIKYGIYLEFGTGRIVIRPKTKKMLAWKDASGDWHFAKQVTHPGIKVGTPENPRTTWPAKEATGTERGSSNEQMPWLRSAWLQSKKEIIEKLENAIPIKD